MGKLIIQQETAVKRIDLMHPIERVPATAQQVGWYMVNGRNAGLILAFTGGHTANLTYGEIGELQRDLSNFSE